MMRCGDPWRLAQVIPRALTRVRLQRAARTPPRATRVRERTRAGPREDHARVVRRLDERRPGVSRPARGLTGDGRRARRARTHGDSLDHARALPAPYAFCSLPGVGTVPGTFFGASKERPGPASASHDRARATQGRTHARRERCKKMEARATSRVREHLWPWARKGL